MQKSASCQWLGSNVVMPVSPGALNNLQSCLNTEMCMHCMLDHGVTTGMHIQSLIFPQTGREYYVQSPKYDRHT